MKWYLANAAARVKFAVRNPRYAMKSVARQLTLADERFLACATGVSTVQICRSLQEPINTPNFVSHICESESVFREGIASADFWGKKVLIQYAAVRAFRPDVVVETGVASGVSSAYILLALERNQKGILHSVDDGDPRYCPKGQAPGWIVPQHLRSRWHLRFGDATKVLPDLFRELGEVDMFIHDSLHTYEHMKFELALAHGHLKTGGLLFADDALWNPAFSEFAQSISSPAARVIRGVGVARK